MSVNDKNTSRDFGDSFQLTNWILDPGATHYMTPQVLYFISYSLEDTYKHIEVVDGHHLMVKQKYKFKLKRATTTKILLLKYITTYFWHQIYVTGYFQLLRQ